MRGGISSLAIGDLEKWKASVGPVGSQRAGHSAIIVTLRFAIWQTSPTPDPYGPVGGNNKKSLISYLDSDTK